VIVALLESAELAEKDRKRLVDNIDVAALEMAAARGGNRGAKVILGIIGV
jgi:hypothetical protein